MFQVFAGLDLFRGRVARLVRGRAEEAFYYPGSAEEYARRWVEEGADWLHVIDLDAALGVGDNFQTISTLVRCVKAPAQVGGGVRSLEKAYSLMDAGAARVIVSSMYFKDRGKALELVETLGPERVAVGLDVDGEGFIVVAGWREKTSSRLVEAVEKALGDGFKNILVTDTSRDGTLQGVNTALLRQIPMESRRYIVFGGGVSTVEDVISLKRHGFAGAVLGRALYEGGIGLQRVKHALLEG